MSANIVQKAVGLGSQMLQHAKPHAERFWYYGKVELAPPKLRDIPAAFGTFNRIVKSAKSGAWKQLTVKQAFLNVLVTSEVLCWFFIGECIGKGRLIGYKLP